MKKTYMKFPNHVSVWHTLPDGTRIMKGRRAGVRDCSTCFLTKEEEDAIAAKAGKEAAEKAKQAAEAAVAGVKSDNSKEIEAAEARITAEVKKSEDAINAKAAELVKGNMTQASFDKFKEEEMVKVNEQLAEVGKLTEAMKEQGNKMNELIEKAGPTQQSFEDYLIGSVFGEKGEKLSELKQKNGMVEISTSTLKAAGISTIANTVQDMASPPTSPYLPGIGGAELLVFDIRRNPNFILDKVDLGRTSQPRIAWINETGEEGTPLEVAEGQEKPLISNTFKVEISFAKKIAAYLKITEELEQDVPQLATIIRRMLQERIVRAWDDAIQVAIEAIATPFVAGPMAGSIPFANYWDAIYAMLAQVRVNNFIPNSVNIHPYTNVKMQADKTAEGIYLLPPFKDEIQRILTQANKLSVDNALVGDLKQYKVDVYKEFVLKVGWVNTDFIQNQFCVLGEIRYHRYISDNRKKAIIKGNLGNVTAALDGGSGS